MWFYPTDLTAFRIWIAVLAAVVTIVGVFLFCVAGNIVGPDTKRPKAIRSPESSVLPSHNRKVRFGSAIIINYSESDVTSFPSLPPFDSMDDIVDNSYMELGIVSLAGESYVSVFEDDESVACPRTSIPDSTRNISTSLEVGVAQNLNDDRSTSV